MAHGHREFSPWHFGEESGSHTPSHKFAPYNDYKNWLQNKLYDLDFKVKGQIQGQVFQNAEQSVSKCWTVKGQNQKVKYFISHESLNGLTDFIKMFTLKLT